MVSSYLSSTLPLSATALLSLYKLASQQICTMPAKVVDERTAPAADMDEKKTIIVDFLNEKQPIIIEEPAWVAERDAAVGKAVETHDDAELARLSALPGGFGSSEMRRKAW